MRLARRLGLATALLLGIPFVSWSCKKEASIPGPFGLETRPANTTCLTFTRPATGSVAMQRVWPQVSFNSPIALRQAPGDKSRFYVVEQSGVVQVIGADAGSSPSVAIDITDRVESGGEAGLLGIAFPPDFATSGKVYLSYTAAGTGSAALESRLSEFTTSNGGATFSKASERIVLRIDQPYSNHNGGNILFGPDGFLYMGMGDGGSGGDPENRAQNKNTLLGKMLRLDVSKTEGSKEYAIPPSNPFAGGGGSPEIFAYGLRNPWRWSFDRMTGKLWVGDVGQNAWEEIDVVELGKNYGWRGKEANHCYIDTECNNPEFVDPLAEHSHNEASSITGGYVYRGTAIPSLVGKYVYGDFESGHMWTFTADGLAHTGDRLLSNVGNIASFGEDNDGELYVVLYGGQIHKLVLSTSGSAGGAPMLLSQTGCFSTSDLKQPAAGLIPFGVNAPLWSDGAEKSRWMALPDGQTVGINSDGDFEFPSGTMLIKEFRLGGKRIETRFLVRHSDGNWAGYTYEWRDDESDAQLLTDTKTKTVGSATWTYPSRTDCMRCHTEAAGFSLGPEVGQLNGDYAYAGGTANQLATLHHIGVVSLDQAPSKLTAYPTYTSTAPIEDRAKAYLHANCSQCHRPGSTAPVSIDLRFSSSLRDMNVCGQNPTAGNLGVANAQLLKPGVPAESVIPLRIKSTDTKRMPPLGVRVTDADGVKLIEDWITSLQGCP